MSELQIPDAAWHAAGKAVAAMESEHGVRVKGRGAVAPVIYASARHIVAAELRRLADDLNGAHAQPEMNAGPDAIRQLRARADELDGGAR